MPHKTLLLTAVLALGFAPAPLPRPDTGKEDLKKMQGTWTRVRTRSGTIENEEAAGTTTIVIKGNILKYPSPDDEWEIALEGKQNPKQINYKGTRGGLKGDIWLGIYSLEGDTLTVCNRRIVGGNKRPVNFQETTAGAFLQVFKRVKP